MKTPPVITPNTEGVFFDLPEDIYRKAPGLSQSELKEFINSPTPAHFAARKPKEPTEEMEFGTVFHAYTLTPELFPTSLYVKPTHYPDEKAGMKPWNGNSTWCKNWLETHSDRPLMTQEKIDKLPKMLSSLNRHTAFKESLARGQKEVAHFKKDPATGILVKCRTDLIVMDSAEKTWLWDIKVAQRGGASDEEFYRTCVNFGYDIQAAAYLYITQASKFVFAVIEKEEPFESRCVVLPSEMLVCGLRKYEDAIRRYSECVAKNSWPGYTVGIETLTPPSWAKI